jgi:acetyl-CoA carboxylase carboxyltransferase component
MVRAGSLTVDSSDKQTRFMRFCDCFNIPMIVLVDTSAYMPGTHQEHAGIIRHGAKVLYALNECTVPRIAVIIRKAYGGGNLGMGTFLNFGTDWIYMWPMAELGVLGAEQSVKLFYGKEIMKSDDPKKMMAEKLKIYKEKYANPIYECSSNWYVEDVIEPRETRRTLIRDLRFLKTKKKVRVPRKHGNIPL